MKNLTLTLIGILCLSLMVSCGGEGKKKTKVDASTGSTDSDNGSDGDTDTDTDSDTDTEVDTGTESDTDVDSDTDTDSDTDADAGSTCTCSTVDTCCDGCMPIAEGQGCSDNNACTQIDVCTAGVCAGVSIVCDDSSVCTGVETCDSLSGCQPGTALVCDDGDICNGIETCDSINGCQAGVTLVCDDSIECTEESCDALLGCLHVGDDGECDDEAWCNGLETCDTDEGCEDGTAPDCNDAVDCTEDSCDETNDECMNVPDGGVCSNGLWCDGAEICVRDAGCQEGVAPDCEDDVDCTIDSCNDSDDECKHAPDNTVCSDGGVGFCEGGDYCDVEDGCQIGAGPPNCDDSVVCTEDSCDDVDNQCVNAPDDGECDDSTVCTIDSCETGGCVYTPDHGECDNDLWCDGSEFCDTAEGCQEGTGPECDDSVACTEDSCNDSDDECVNEPDDGNCDDSAWCNGDETCDTASNCQPGIPPNCDDSVACTEDGCDDEEDECTHVPDSGICDNGLFCDGAETCNIDLDCQDGTPLKCNDTDICTHDSCDEVEEGCVNNPLDASVCDEDAGEPDECVVWPEGGDLPDEDFEGRCLPARLSNVGGLEPVLGQSDCEGTYYCTPCYNPASGDEYGSCSIKGDEPNTPPEDNMWDKCCETDTLVDGGTALKKRGVCVPDVFISTLYGTPQGNLDQVYSIDTCEGPYHCVNDIIAADPSASLPVCNPNGHCYNPIGPGSGIGVAFGGGVCSIQCILDTHGGPVDEGASPGWDTPSDQDCVEGEEVCITCQWDRYWRMTPESCDNSPGFDGYNEVGECYTGACGQQEPRCN